VSAAASHTRYGAGISLANVERRGDGDALAMLGAGIAPARVGGGSRVPCSMMLLVVCEKAE